MVALSALRQVNEVETKFIVTGEDQMRRAMEGVAGAQDRVARSTDALAVATEKVQGRQLARATASERLARSLDQEYAKAERLKATQEQIQRFTASGLYGQSESERLMSLAATKYGPNGNDNDPTRRGLSRYDKDFIKYQGFDVASSLGSGAGLTAVAFQQGPQVLQQLADREGGLKAGLKQLGESAMGLVTPFTVAGAAVAAAAVTFGVAASQAAKDQAVLTRSLQTTGASTGASVAQLDMLAVRNAEAGKISTSTAREITAAYASTGEIGLPVFDTLIAKTSEYARLTGTEVSAAASELARMFAEPAKGAEDLGNKLGGLDDNTRQHIITLAEQGDKMAAQTSLAEALKTQIDANAAATTKWGNAWTYVSSTADKAWESIKRAAGGSVTTPQTVLSDLQERLKQVDQNSPGSPLAKQIRADRDAALAEVEKTEKAAADRAFREKAIKDSVAAGDIARDLDPTARQYRELIKKRDQLSASLDSPTSRSSLADIGGTEQARDAYTRAIDSMKDANGKLIDSQERLRLQDQLRLDSLKATTTAEKVAIAERTKALELQGKPLTVADAEAQKLRAGMIARAEADSKDGKKKDKAEASDDYDRATRSLDDRIRRQQQEAATFGMGADAVARYRAETDLLTAAKRAERDITPALSAEVQGYADRAAEAARQQEALRESMQTMDNIRGAGREVFGGIGRDLSHGVGAANTLNNALGRLQDRIMSMATNSLADAIFGRSESSGGLLAGMLGGPSAGSPLAGAQGPSLPGTGLLDSFGSGIKSLLGYADGGIPGLSPNGIISGPGTSRSDSILARVSNREAIVNAAAVDKYGVDFIGSLNRLTLPAFANGRPDHYAGAPSGTGGEPAIFVRAAA